jgi:molybdopterin synthase catalytic subunit
MRIEVRAGALDPWFEVKRFQESELGHFGACGATAVFVGTMRDLNEGERVRAMRLEHYPGMTEQHLGEIAAQARSRWDIVDLLIIHRVGELEPGDPIVVVAVWSAHRAAAFDACRFIIEDLKSRAPFWKKEQLEEHSRWVETNTPG